MSNEVRNYRDNVFCIMMQDKKHILSVYNALNKTNYCNPDEVNVVTLEGAICISIKNDAAFVLDTRLYLYEQQSTVNPNMPLRDLIYVTKEYQQLINTKDLYKSTPIYIQEPKFVVFYNGERAYPATKVCSLSDMYINKSDSPELELKVTVININPGFNDDLLESSESLKGYMTFVNKVRNKRRNKIPTEIAVETSLRECIEENVMADFFTENMEKIKSVSIWEFNQELNDQAKYEEGEEDGYNRGLNDGRSQGITVLINYSKELGISYESTKIALINKYNISMDEAEKYMSETW